MAHFPVSQDQSSGTGPANGNRNRTPSSAYNRDGMFRSIYLRILGYAKTRPEPRWQWDDIASGKRRPWKQLQDSTRSLAREAVSSGDSLRQEMTRQALITLYDDLRADCLSLFPETQAPSVPTAVLEETVAQGLCDPFGIELARFPTKANAEKALPAIQAHWISLGRLKAAVIKTIHAGETRGWA